MPHKLIKTLSILQSQQKQRGFTLVETMVSLAVGMAIIIATLSLYSKTFGINSFQLRASQLNSELRIAMNQITRDIRRSGYTPELTELINTTPAISTTATCSTNTGAGGKSISITYDLDSNGEPDTFEYQFTTISGVGAIQSRSKINSGTISAWMNITDPSIVNILANSGTTPLPGFCIVPTNKQIVRDGKSITVSNYEIIIRGNLVRDNSTTRTIRETIRTRNETITTSP